MTSEEILSCYFQHIGGAMDAAYDAVEEVDELARSAPHEAWPLIRQLIDRAPSDESLSYVAAGPLEILLSKHGELIASTVRADAEKNDRIGQALTHVLLSNPSPVIRKELSEWIRFVD